MLKPLVRAASVSGKKYRPHAQLKHICRNDAIEMWRHCKKQNLSGEQPAAMVVGLVAGVVAEMSCVDVEVSAQA